MMVLRLAVAGLACLTAFGSAGAGPAAAVNESARRLPVAYDVDVVVVGGSTGAVAAAVAAAEAGAKVFLAAPHPYLGDDMTATLRLWLEPGEEPNTPLARRIYSDPVLNVQGPDPNRLPFVYKADRPASPRHPETAAGNRLTDGLWLSAVHHSVQYDGDVNIIADLGKEQAVAGLRISTFHRDAEPAGFKIDQIAVFASHDAKSWQPLTVLRDGQYEGDERMTWTAAVKTTARYFKFAVRKAAGVHRVLLGEIEIIKPAGPRKAGDQQARPRPPRPLHVKQTLDDALLKAGVHFLYNCYVTDVLSDQAGEPSGIVMANRAGRQAVLARVVIDATDRAVAARLAGARFRPYPAGVHTFHRVVIGGQPQQGQELTARVIEPPFLGPWPNLAGTSSGRFQIIDYTLQLPMKDGSWRSWAAAEQRARDLTYHREQQFTSDDLFEVPADPMQAETPVRAGAEPGRLPLGAFRPAGVPHLYVLGGCAEVPRTTAARLLRPLALMALGQRIGQAAAAEAKSRARPAGVHLAGRPTETPAAAGDTKEMLRGVRPIHRAPTVAQQARALPVLGTYDVVVIGGGTSGAAAGIGAARRGAKTLVVEHLHALGGVGTAGYISGYYWGNRVGFTASIPTGDRWVPEQKAQWWRRANLEAGAELWFGCIGCGAFVHDGQVRGAVVATPFGRGVVLAKVVIDTTGNADIAAAAGAQTIYTDASEFGMQGTGLPPRRLGATYTNTDFSIVDETDIEDVWHFFVYAKKKYANAFDQGQLVDTRERRRIVGDYTLTVEDAFLGRTFPDSIVRAYSNFDTHGYTIHPLFEITHPEKRGFYVYVPYRCNVPKGLEGILVGGLGVSAHRDALPLIRMQADMQNQGYALGVAAAMLADTGTLVRALNVAELQRHLVKIGNLPQTVLEAGDSLPLPDERIAAAVAKLASVEDVAAIFTSPDRALPQLRRAYQHCQDADKKLRYAHMLALLGDDTGLQTLADAVAAQQQWDKGWDYRAMGQYGSALSRLDTLIVALGRTRSQAALPVIIEKTKLLSAQVAFSHHRACALALELIGDRAGAAPLAAVLRKDGMTGYVHDTVQKAEQFDRRSRGGTSSVQTRRDSLRELLLARALYRCGDWQGLGQRILRAYTRDLRGHLARHAQAVLQAGNHPRTGSR